MASIQINLIEIPSKISEWPVWDVGKGGATDGNNFISGVKNKVAAPKHSVVHRCNEENNFHTISVGDNDINKNPTMICMIFMKLPPENSPCVGIMCKREEEEQFN